MDEVDGFQDLFEDDGVSSGDDAGGRDEEQIDDRQVSGANLELGNDGGRGDGGPSEEADKAAKPRVIRNPQPKLDAQRIMDRKRGIIALEEAFADFKPRGKGFEHQDLEVVLKRMEHWAHRLYPKLPFDDVVRQVSHLGKKMAVQTYLRKVRSGVAMTEADGDDQVLDLDDDLDDNPTVAVAPSGGDERIQRYDDDGGDQAEFDRLFRMEVNNTASTPSRVRAGEEAGNELTEEQVSRIRRNKELAEEKRRQRRDAATSGGGGSSQPDISALDNL